VKGRQRIADAITDPQCLKLVILDGDADRRTRHGHAL